MTIGQISTLLGIATTVGAVSLVPDAWFLDKVVELNRATLTNSVQVAQVTSDQLEFRQADIDSAKIISDELVNLRLYIEEKADQETRERRIDRLEDRIADATNDIVAQQSEIDRLDRIINGGSAAPASIETYNARDRAESQITVLEARIQADSRELARIMQ